MYIFKYILFFSILILPWASSNTMEVYRKSKPKDFERSKAKTGLLNNNDLQSTLIQKQLEEEKLRTELQKQEEKEKELADEIARLKRIEEELDYIEKMEEKQNIIELQEVKIRKMQEKIELIKKQNNYKDLPEYQQYINEYKALFEQYSQLVKDWSAQRKFLSLAEESILNNEKKATRPKFQAPAQEVLSSFLEGLPLPQPKQKGRAKNQKKKTNQKPNNKSNKQNSTRNNKENNNTTNIVGKVLQPDTEIKHSKTAAIQCAIQALASTQPSTVSIDLNTIRYEKNILKYFNEDARTRYNQRSILYHTLNPIIDQFVLHGPRMIVKRNETKAIKQNKYKLPGIIDYGDSRLKHVYFELTIDATNVCYHRGFIPMNPTEKEKFLQQLASYPQETTSTNQITAKDHLLYPEVTYVEKGGVSWQEKGFSFAKVNDPKNNVHLKLYKFPIEDGAQ